MPRAGAAPPDFFSQFERGGRNAVTGHLKAPAGVHTRRRDKFRAASAMAPFDYAKGPSSEAQQDPRFDLCGTDLFLSENDSVATFSVE